MTLNTFTLNDRRRLQHYLNLPIQEIREGSRLYQNLIRVEQIDTDEETTIAVDVQRRLDLIDAVDSVNGATSSLNDAIRSSDSAAKIVDVDGRIRIEYADFIKGSSYSGEAGSIERYKNKLIADIKRDIGLSQQSGSNQLRAVYPGGITQNRSRLGFGFYSN